MFEISSETTTRYPYISIHPFHISTTSRNPISHPWQLPGNEKLALSGVTSWRIICKKDCVFGHVGYCSATCDHQWESPKKNNQGLQDSNKNTKGEASVLSWAPKLAYLKPWSHAIYCYKGCTMHNPKSTTNSEGSTFWLNVFLDYGALLPRLCKIWREASTPMLSPDQKRMCASRYCHNSTRSVVKTMQT